MILTFFITEQSLQNSFQTLKSHTPSLAAGIRSKTLCRPTGFLHDVLDTQEGRSNQKQTTITTNLFLDNFILVVMMLQDGNRG
jgi:hypothetical protein